MLGLKRQFDFMQASEAKYKKKYSKPRSQKDYQSKKKGKSREHLFRQRGAPISTSTRTKSRTTRVVIALVDAL
jgi:hypothetical protein